MPSIKISDCQIGINEENKIQASFKVEVPKDMLLDGAKRMGLSASADLTDKAHGKERKTTKYSATGDIEKFRLAANAAERGITTGVRNAFGFSGTVNREGKGSVDRAQNVHYLVTINDPYSQGSVAHVAAIFDGSPCGLKYVNGAQTKVAPQLIDYSSSARDTKPAANYTDMVQMIQSAVLASMQNPDVVNARPTLQRW